MAGTRERGVAEVFLDSDASNAFLSKGRWEVVMALGVLWNLIEQAFLEPVRFYGCFFAWEDSGSQNANDSQLQRFPDP